MLGTRQKVADIEPRVRAHAEAVLAKNRAASAGDLSPDAPQDPADLYERLDAGTFTRYEIVAHAKIGFHHIYKTKYIGTEAWVVQERWAEQDGRWLIRESALLRTELAER